MDSNNQNKENPHILKELKSMNRHTKYILVDRNRGKTVCFDDRYTRDISKSDVRNTVVIRLIFVITRKACAARSL